MNGAVLRIEGVTFVTIKNLSNGIVKNTAAIISPDISKDIIIGYPQLKELGVIQENFPTFLPIDNEFEKIKAAISLEFPNVIHDTLPEKAMDGKPMTITLSPDKKPFRILTARPIPHHYQSEAEELVSELLHKQIIARVKETTKWTAPAFLVPKNKRLGKTARNNLVRLVTDLSHLNRYIVQPIHPFPSANTILSNIPSSSKYFASLNAISGYHQVPLDEKSSYLTTFLLPCGRFRYLRAPMGLCSSSDEWCRRSDVTIENVNGVHKLVDDYLIMGDTIEQLTARIREILEKCRKQNLTISKQKFVIGRNIKFAGFNLSKDGVEPDKAKTNAISQFPIPKDVSGLLLNWLWNLTRSLVEVSLPMDPKDDDNVLI